MRRRSSSIEGSLCLLLGLAFDQDLQRLLDFVDGFLLFLWMTLSYSAVLLRKSFGVPTMYTKVVSSRNELEVRDSAFGEFVSSSSSKEMPANRL